MRDTPRVFWIFQLLYWAGYAVSGYIIVPGVFAFLSPLSAAAIWVGEAALGLTLTTALRARYQRRESGSRQVVAVVLASVAGGAVWALCSVSLWKLLHSLSILGDPLAQVPSAVDVPLPLALLIVAANDAFFLTTWSAIYLVVRSWREVHAQTERTLRAQTLAREAQLQMLRYQINPHFLFNALNSLRGLIDEDPARAKGVVNELSDFLRYSLLPTTELLVPLREEIGAVRAYLAVEQARFEERLRVRIRVDPAAEHVRVPAFLLHPLTENAVKYGRQSSPALLELLVEASARGGVLRLTVSNTGAWSPPDGAVEGERTGLGLRNVRQRLQETFPEHHRLSIAEHDGWVHVTIEIQVGKTGAPALASYAAPAGERRA